MRPSNLKTKIFLDSGNPAETREVLSLLGFLDGQTTNPSLIAKNPETLGRKFSQKEIYDFYKKVVTEISGLIPQGSVSIEVYADANTSAEEMMKQAREFYTWIPNAPDTSRSDGHPLRYGASHIKFPTTTEGLKAAEMSVKEGIRVNMTLVFSQEQAAAVYAATKGAKKGDVFLSPFVGRLDDIGENGMDLIANILKMYSTGDGHVEVLAASIRSQEHMAKCLELGCDIITAPIKVLKDWRPISPPLPPGEGRGEGLNLKLIPYQEITLDKPWKNYNIQHNLTDKGIEKFAADWNSLIEHS